MTLIEILSETDSVRRPHWPQGVYLKYWEGPDSYLRDLVFFLDTKPNHIRVDRHLMSSDIFADDWYNYIHKNKNTE